MVMNFIKKDDLIDQKGEILDLKNLVDFENKNELNDFYELDTKLNKKLDQKLDFNQIKKANNPDNDLDKWLAYPKSIALVNEQIKFVKEYNSERCKFWRSIGLDRYAWVC